MGQHKHNPRAKWGYWEAVEERAIGNLKKLFTEENHTLDEDAFDDLLSLQGDDVANYILKLTIFNDLKDFGRAQVSVQRFGDFIGISPLLAKHGINTAPLADKAVFFRYANGKSSFEIYLDKRDTGLLEVYRQEGYVELPLKEFTEKSNIPLSSLTYGAMRAGVNGDDDRYIIRIRYDMNVKPPYEIGFPEDDWIIK